MADNEDYSHVIPRDCICGAPISLERLDALPRTAWCSSCAKHNPPKTVYDAETLCAKASPSGQNGWSPGS
jgi:hypothetical protein